MSNAKIYDNMLEERDLHSIIDFYGIQSGHDNIHYGINKNLEYHIPENFIYKKFNNIFNEIFGPDHVFDTGSVKESKHPYPLHVDSRTQHNLIPGLVSFGNGAKNYNKSVIVPLVEGEQFRTIGFKVWTEINPKYPTTLDEYTEYLITLNHLKREDFSHLSDREFESIHQLEVDFDYTWKLGDILVFDRTQWHISTSFSDNKSIKKFLIFFIE